MMDHEATERFNALLKQWRKQGRKIGWAELNEAYRLAREIEAQGPPPVRGER